MGVEVIFKMEEDFSADVWTKLGLKISLPFHSCVKKLRNYTFHNVRKKFFKNPSPYI